MSFYQLYFDFLSVDILLSRLSVLRANPASRICSFLFQPVSSVATSPISPAMKIGETTLKTRCNYKLSGNGVHQFNVFQLDMSLINSVAVPAKWFVIPRETARSFVANFQSGFLSRSPPTTTMPKNPWSESMTFIADSASHLPQTFGSYIISSDILEELESDASDYPP